MLFNKRTVKVSSLQADFHDVVKLETQLPLNVVYCCKMCVFSSESELELDSKSIWVHELRTRMNNLRCKWLICSTKHHRGVYWKHSEYWWIACCCTCWSSYEALTEWKKKSRPCFSEGQMMSTQRTGRKSFFAFTVPFQTTCCTCLCFSCPWAQIKWIHSYAGVWPDSVSFYLHKFSKRPLKEIHQEL